MSKPEYTHQCRYCAYCVFTVDENYWCDEKNEYIAAPKRPNRCAAFLFNAIPADDPYGKPYEPLRGGIYLQARWCFPYRKSERKSVTKTGLEIPHTSRPDLDNLEKSLLDVLTRLRFWEDDAQVFTKSTAKVWGPSSYLALAIKTQAELFNAERE